MPVYMYSTTNRQKRFGSSSSQAQPAYILAAAPSMGGMLLSLASSASSSAIRASLASSVRGCRSYDVIGLSRSIFCSTLSVSFRSRGVSASARPEFTNSSSVQQQRAFGSAAVERGCLHKALTLAALVGHGHDPLREDVVEDGDAVAVAQVPVAPVPRAAAGDDAKLPESAMLCKRIG